MAFNTNQLLDTIDLFVVALETRFLGFLSSHSITTIGGEKVEKTFHWDLGAVWRLGPVTISLQGKPNDSHMTIELTEEEGVDPIIFFFRFGHNDWRTSGYDLSFVTNQEVLEALCQEKPLSWGQMFIIVTCFVENTADFLGYFATSIGGTTDE